MPEGTLPALAGWESFYVIVGSSGAALIGLQFVVIVLITEVRQKASPDLPVNARRRRPFVSGKSPPRRDTR